MSKIREIQVFDAVGNPIGSTAGALNVNVSSPTPLPTSVDVIKGTLSTVNSSASPLGIAGVFTGVGENILNYAISFVSVYSDVAGMLSIQGSQDGVDWSFTDDFNVDAGQHKTFSINPATLYFRAVYTNGAAAQSQFGLQVIYKSVYAKPSSHKIEDSIDGDDDAELVKSVISGVDENNIYRNARVSEGGFLVTDDFFLEIAEGNVTGHSIYRKFGRVASIQLASPADCWEFGITPGAEQYTWSTTAAIDSMSSSNAADTQAITITMLDANYVEFTQVVNLQGQTRVPLIPGLRFNRAFNSNGVATIGDVYIYENTPIVAGVPTLVTMVRGYFSIASQQTLQSIYTVPAGKNAYLYELKTAMGGRKAGFATYEAYLRTPGGVFLIKDTHDLTVTGTSYSNDMFNAPRFFPEKTDFKPLITVDTNGIGFSVSFVVVLVDI